MANYFKTAKAFSEQSKDLADGIKAFAKDAILERKGDIRAFSAHSREEQNKLINKEFMAEVAKRSGYSLAEGASNTEAMRYASNPMVKYFANQIKTEMIDMILPDVLMNGALRYIAEFKYADLGDTISFNVENNTLFTVSKAGYRKRNTNIQKSFKTTVTMSGENHMITVGDDLYNIVTGFANIADDVMRATLSMETCMLFEAYSNFTNAMNNLTGNLKVVNYSEKGLIKLCETVTAYNQGRKAVILGTPSALKSVLPSNANYRYLLDSEYVKLGHLQTFNGKIYFTRIKINHAHTVMCVY